MSALLRLGRSADFDKAHTMATPKKRPASLDTQDTKAARLAIESGLIEFPPMRETWPDALKAEVAEVRIKLLGQWRARGREQFDLFFDLHTRIYG